MKINKFKKKSKQIIYHKKENHTIERKNNGMTTLYFGYPARISRREEREEKKNSPLQILLHASSLDISNNKAVGSFWASKAATCTV
jgi:hypothetical protein